MATLKLNTEFSTKNDACSFITGKPMKNNYRMEEITDKYNIIFIQRGEASYLRKGEKIVTGLNRVYADRVESLRANGKNFVLDIKHLPTTNSTACSRLAVFLPKLAISTIRSLRRLPTTLTFKP